LNNKETEVVVKEQKERNVERKGESRERKVELLSERSKKDEHARRRSVAGTSGGVMCEW